MTVRLYFDTNVYRHITQCGEAQRIRSLILDCKARLIASDGNLFETYAIADLALRREEIRTLTQTATDFESHPQSWHQAAELLNAIRKHRRRWLRPVAFTRQARAFLDRHRRRWQEARLGDLPDAAAYATFRRDYEDGVAHRSGFQKEVRKDRLADTAERLLHRRGGSPLAERRLDLSDPEVYWRADCLLAWSEALSARNPSSRDYFDWLAPYLLQNAFEGSDYPAFWLDDVEHNDVPKNRLTALVGFYQLDSKVTHGNAEDSQHACHALEVAHFFTADRPFFTNLSGAASHFLRFASLHLVDRAAPSVLPFVQAALTTAPRTRTHGGSDVTTKA